MQITANDIAIEVEDHGNPDDPAILLIMGFGAQLVLRPEALVETLAGKDVAKNIEGARFETLQGMGHDLPPALLPEVAEMIAAHCRENTPAVV